LQSHYFPSHTIGCAPGLIDPDGRTKRKIREFPQQNRVSSAKMAYLYDSQPYIGRQIATVGLLQLKKIQKEQNPAMSRVYEFKPG
jgi:hypothetical protein